MRLVAYLFCLVATLGNLNLARAEGIKTSVYEYTNKDQTQVYLLAQNKDSAQVFVCGAKKGAATLPGFLANPNLDILAREHCTPLFTGNNVGRMMKGVRNGQLISLHLGGTDTPETKALSMLGDAKSWLGVFHLNENENQTLLFTGVGIEVGAGTPRTDSVRVTLQKVAEGELTGTYPMLPLVTR